MPPSHSSSCQPLSFSSIEFRLEAHLFSSVAPLDLKSVNYLSSLRGAAGPLKLHHYQGKKCLRLLYISHVSAVTALDPI